MSNLDHIDLKLGFVFSKSSILILFFILQGIIMSLIIESVLAGDVQSRVVKKKNYNVFATYHKKHKNIKKVKWIKANLLNEKKVNEIPHDHLIKDFTEIENIISPYIHG